MKNLPILLFSILISFNSYAESDRVDLDIRYSSNSFSAFSTLLKQLSEMKSIKVNNKTFIIEFSNNEVFIDNYFDTLSFNLFNQENSLRFRQRFVNLMPYSQVIQYKKSLSNGDAIPGSMYEFKMEVKDKIINEADLLNVVVNENNDKFQLIEKLSKDLNTSKLKRIFTAFQNRDRMCLYDDLGVQTYTITFDKVYYFNKLNYVPYWVIEFEVNEKLFTIANINDKTTLISNLQIIINNIVDGDFYLVKDNKYTTGIKKLNLIESKRAIVDYLNWLEVIAIIIALLIIFVLRNRARNL